LDERDDGQNVRAPTLEDLARICSALNQSGARYLLIGGFAVITHGAGRTTKDIDFLIDPSPENVGRVKEALRVLPDNAAAEIGETDLQTYSVVRVADEVLVDLLGSACGVTYESACAEAEHFDIQGVSVPVADKGTLIRTKVTVRPSDQIDRAFLESLLREEGRRG
jgi:hypothetical protein